MSSHMLLVGGSGEVHPKVKKLGFRSSFIFDIKTLKNRKNMDIYDRILALPINNHNDWIEIASTIHKLDPFDSIGGFNELTQEHAALIAQKLKLPYHSHETIMITRQKYQMREHLRKLGLDNTQSKIVQNSEEIEEFGLKYGYPIIIKPVDGRGSLSVSIVRSIDEIKKAMAWFLKWSPKSQILVEQFLEGEEFSVEAFSEDSQHKIVSVTQKFKDPVTFVEIGHCVPAPISNENRIMIEVYVRKLLDAIGLKNGPTHTEVILTESGPKVVETHARLAGDSIVELMELTTGIDLDQMWILQSGGEKVYNKVLITHNQFASIYFITPKQEGVLRKIDGLEEAKKQSGVVRVEIEVKIGEKLENAYDSYSRAAYAIAVGTSAAQAVQNAQKAVSKLKFIVE